MSLIQITPVDESPEGTDDEHGCECCLNRIRVAGLRRKRHAAWIARGAKRHRSSQDSGQG